MLPKEACCGTWRICCGLESTLGDGWSAPMNVLPIRGPCGPCCGGLLMFAFAAGLSALLGLKARLGPRASAPPGDISLLFSGRSSDGPRIASGGAGLRSLGSFVGVLLRGPIAVGIELPLIRGGGADCCGGGPGDDCEPAVRGILDPIPGGGPPESPPGGPPESPPGGPP